MIDAADERLAKFKRLTKQEFKLGLIHQGYDFLTRAVWQGNLKILGFEHCGHRLVKSPQMLSKPNVSLPKRCAKQGVGKRIGGAVYVHRQYEKVLGEGLVTAKASLPSGFDYTVIKHNELNGNWSFIHCPDFDKAEEPSTGKYAVIHPDGTIKLQPALADPYIYHHKWMFVADDYQGFDVTKSQQRSVAWMSLDGVDKSLIGKASYWNNQVVPRLAESSDEEWLHSDEVRKRLNLTTCELAHMREAGELEFIKRGNAYLYCMPSDP